MEADDDDDLPTAAQTVKSAKGISVTLRDVNISKEGRVTVAGRDESGRTQLETTAVDESEESSSEEEEEEEKPKAQRAAKPATSTQLDEDEESSEYETDSEEEEPAKPAFRPVFVPKRNRDTVAAAEAERQDTEAALERKEQEAEERKKQSHDLVAESIRRELAEKEKEEEVPDVDDTDGVDADAEFEAWKLRELGRIKRDKESEIRREQEREEVERRRALPEEQRLKEDLEHAQKSRDAKPKGQQKFLQKYWHKGAFHQDADVLTRHDFTESTQSTVDVSALPAVMQVKNFGKRGRTKYTHLVDQDTTAQTSGFGGAGAQNANGRPNDTQGCFTCGGPHMKKDCPNNTGPIHRSSDTGWRQDRNGGRGDGESWKGRDRRDRDRPDDRDRYSRDSDGHRDSYNSSNRDRGYRDRDADNGYSRDGRSYDSRKRSPSPRRPYDSKRRSPSPRRYDKRHRERDRSAEAEVPDKRRRRD